MSNKLLYKLWNARHIKLSNSEVIGSSVSTLLARLRISIVTHSSPTHWDTRSTTKFHQNVRSSFGWARFWGVCLSSDSRRPAWLEQRFQDTCTRSRRDCDLELLRAPVASNVRIRSCQRTIKPRINASCQKVGWRNTVLQIKGWGARSSIQLDLVKRTRERRGLIQHRFLKFNRQRLILAEIKH